MLTTDQKGAVAEAAIAYNALKLGIGVSRPLGDERYDLVFDFHPGLVRVQCKWAVRHGDVIVVRCYSARRCADGVLRRLYTSEEVDAFASYCETLDRCYFIPFNAVPPGGVLHLRLSATRNNQRLGVRWGDEFRSQLHLASATGP